MPVQKRQAPSHVSILVFVGYVFAGLLCSAILVQALPFTVIMGSWPIRVWSTMVLSSVIPTAFSQEVDLGWYPPRNTSINNLDDVLAGEGVYGFIFNTSETSDAEYGTYNWCNMPHVRKTEYIKPPAEYELKYVEVVGLIPLPSDSDTFWLRSARFKDITSEHRMKATLSQ